MCSSRARPRWTMPAATEPGSSVASLKVNLRPGPAPGRFLSASEMSIERRFVQISRVRARPAAELRHLGVVVLSPPALVPSLRQLTLAHRRSSLRCTEGSEWDSIWIDHGCARDRAPSPRVTSSDAGCVEVASSRSSAWANSALSAAGGWQSDSRAQTQGAHYKGCASHSLQPPWRTRQGGGFPRALGTSAVAAAATPSVGAPRE